MSLSELSVLGHQPLADTHGLIAPVHIGAAGRRLEKIRRASRYGLKLLCDIVAAFPCRDKTYMALIPTDADEDADVFLYRYEGDLEDEDSLKLIDIEDDDEFEAASDAFDEYLDELEFNEMIGDGE